MPVLGSLPWLLRDPLRFFTTMAQDYGPISHARLVNVSLYTVADPELLEELFNGKHKQCIKDAATRGLRPLVGQGLLTSEGDLWKRQRKLAAQPFTPKRMRAYEQTMVECASAAFARFRDGERRDFHADAMAITLEIVAKTLLGIEDPAELHRVSHIVDVAMAYFQERLYSWGALLPPEFPTPRWLRFQRAKRELDAIVGRVIDRARREDSTADHLLARLLRARDDDGQPMSEQQLLDEAVTMLLAGHETTALSLMYGAYLLATHPVESRALAHEIDAVLGGRPARADDLERLPYLDAVVRETLRLYPPAYALGREVVEPFELGGYTLPVGAQIAVVPFAMHRNRRFWKEPERFRPERWLDGETRNLPRYAYMPFGGGHRVCIGNHFASVELSLVLATLVQQVRLEVRPKLRLRLRPVITLRVPSGLRVKVRRRKLPANAANDAPGWFSAENQPPQASPAVCLESARTHETVQPAASLAACPHGVSGHVDGRGEREPA